MPADLIFIAGPTAVGKSEIALLIAEKVGGEIISVDSMQVYRGMDIGTAKPSSADRERVPHHLIDIVDVTEPFDAAQFVRHAQAAVEQIRGRGRTPIFCGGTGLYFKAFLEGLGDAPPGDLQLRRTLEETPPAELLKELKSRDPKTFDQIDRKNLRRVIRAVEAIRLTGKPFSSQRSKWTKSHQTPGRLVALSRTNEDLQARIAQRVEAMFRRGLVAETEQLLKRGLARNKVAMQALGYRQVIEHFEGKRDLAHTIELVKIRTRQFAKRQRTWFRNQLPMTWTQISPDESLAEVVDAIQTMSGRA